MKIKILKVITIFSLFFFSACASPYYSDSVEFSKQSNDEVIKDPESYVKVCTGFLYNKIKIDNLAYSYCSKHNTISKYITTRYFTDCSLFSPIAHVYDCVNKVQL